MSAAREEVLRRVRTALGSTEARATEPLADGPGADGPGAGTGTSAAVVRDYRRAGAAGPDQLPVDLAALLTDRLIDYRADVVRCAADDVAREVAARCAARGIDDLVVPTGFPPDWLDDVTARCVPAAGLSTTELDGMGGTISLCATAIAETGTIVLDAGTGQGPRALSLVPDYLLLIVREEQIVAGVPDGVAVLDPTRPLTWISGPSATSDIELQRVEGVHGPRTLDVVLVHPMPGPAGRI